MKLSPNCGICGFEKWMLDGSKFGVHVCRRCDTVAQNSIAIGRRVGPPNAPGTDDGWFDAPWGDLR